MKEDKEPCKVCGKRSEHGCSYTLCPKRRPVTANVPDGCEQLSTGGYMRISPTTKE